MTFRDCREALADTIASASGVTTSPRAKGHATPPEVWVVPATISDAEAFQPVAHTYTFDVVVLVSPTDWESAQIALDDLLDPETSGSIWQAAESDQTLDGFASSVRVQGMTDYGLGEVGGTEVFRATLRVEVLI